MVQLLVFLMDIVKIVFKEIKLAPVAQRIEHLTSDQKVRGSNPCGRTINLSFYLLIGYSYASFREG